MWPFRCSPIQNDVQEVITRSLGRVVLETWLGSNPSFWIQTKRWDQVQALQYAVSGVDEAPCQSVYNAVEPLGNEDDLPSLTKFLDGCEQ
jgi:hypothetical protein